jgi:N-carbamoyl-L-amino-acid hydrolase
MQLTLDRDRLVQTMQTQAAIGETPEGGLDRVALSQADSEVRDWFAEAMAEAGLSTRVDAVGNMFGRRTGTDSDAAPVLLGSHLDSQPNGGIYDGALGVVAALEFVRSLDDEGIETERPIEIVNWTNEEGTRFQPAGEASGSQVWAGRASVDQAYETVDEDGVRFEDALEAIGYRGEHAAEPPTEYDAYLELHVEQGPVMAEAGADVGVVTGVVSRSWGSITFDGEADHSGTTPMHLRNDAAVAAADVIRTTRQIAGTVGEETVGTSGYLDVSPNSINVVAGETTVTWGFRDPSDAVVDEAREKLLSEAATAAEREGLDWQYEDKMRSTSTEFSERCIDAVQSAADDLGYDSMQLASAAGHDAPTLTSVCDAGMVFAVSENGKSHCPDEYTTWDHCHVAANALSTAALRLANEPADAAQ